MDATTERLSDYAHRLSYAHLSAETVHQVKRTLVDTLGCAAGAFDGEPAGLAVRLCARVTRPPPRAAAGVCGFRLVRQPRARPLSRLQRHLCGAGDGPPERHDSSGAGAG